LSTNSRAPGETWRAGLGRAALPPPGGGAVVLPAVGEVAAVEHGAHVEVPVGDFFTAAMLGSVNHGERGDAGRRLGCLVALLVVLLSVLGILGVFGGNLGGDALLV